LSLKLTFSENIFLHLFLHGLLDLSQILQIDYRIYLLSVTQLHDTLCSIIFHWLVQMLSLHETIVHSQYNICRVTTIQTQKISDFCRRNCRKYVEQIHIC